MLQLSSPEQQQHLAPRIKTNARRYLSPLSSKRRGSWKDRASLIGCSMKALGCSVLLVLWACCGAQGEGSKCGPLPILLNGDIVGIPKPSYPSGTTVEYKCQSYHKILGNSKVTCLNGAWSVLPECLEPCTANPEEMAKNNIILRWTVDKKIYMEHDQYVDFVCLSRDYIQDKESPPFRIKCNRGILLYPKCIKQDADLGTHFIDFAESFTEDLLNSLESRSQPSSPTVQRSHRRQRVRQLPDSDSDVPQNDVAEVQNTPQNPAPPERQVARRQRLQQFFRRRTRHVSADLIMMMTPVPVWWN